ncbi:hypothetical protein D3C78_1764790 [compost metagenome]
MVKQIIKASSRGRLIAAHSNGRMIKVNGKGRLSSARELKVSVPSNTNSSSNRFSVLNIERR